MMKWAALLVLLAFAADVGETWRFDSLTDRQHAVTVEGAPRVVDGARVRG
jgi:hypothetical protein